MTEARMQWRWHRSASPSDDLQEVQSHCLHLIGTTLILEKPPLLNFIGL